VAEFDLWAEYYDVIHNGLPGEAEFYVGQAVRIGGETLELGCGTGRIAIPMAMSGVRVTGLDNSKAMLDVCREKANEVGSVPGSLHLVQADMRDFALDREYDFVAMAYRTFMHLMSQDEQRRCLVNVRRHLAADGVFILNLWAPRPSSVALLAGNGSGGLRFAGEHPLRNDDLRLVHYCGSRVNEYLQELSEEHVLHVVDAQGKVRRSQVLSLVRTWLTVREMDNLVRLSGFEIRALFGDFDCGPFTQHSTEMIWVLGKPSNPTDVGQPAWLSREC